MVKTSSSSAGNEGSIPGLGTKLSRGRSRLQGVWWVMGQLSPCSAPTEPPLLNLCATTKTQCSQINKYSINKQTEEAV